MGEEVGKEVKGAAGGMSALEMKQGESAERRG
jgi:hypothetical protein